MQPNFINKLKQLRRKLTRWILVHGLSRWLLVLLSVLACDMLLDRVFKLDFAQRSILLVAMGSSMLVYFGWRVVRPLLQRTNDDALIYEVESKNPQLKENLISGWQLARQKDLESIGVSEELAAATISNGNLQAEQIDFTKSLDLGHHRQNWVLLSVGILLSTALAIGIARTDIARTNFLRTWFNRNILLRNDQWPQGTYLEIAGAVNGKLVIPRGADYRQLVLISDNSTVIDVNVTLEIDNPGGRTMHLMKPTGKLDGRELAYVFHNVSSPFRFRATGGDDVTSWVDVELVEPPAVIELNLQALLPPYTGIPTVALTGSGPHGVLMGSRLEIEIKTNKPLQRALLKLGDETMPLNSIDKALFGSSSKAAAVEPTVHAVETAGLTNTELSARESSPGNWLALTISPEQLRGGEYEFVLLDESGLSNSRPSKFSLTLKEDQPPKARASLLGISGLVVPRAKVPVSYQVADEFGLLRLYFECQWKAGIDESEQNIDRQLVFNDLAATNPPIREVKDYEVLDLLPLNLTPGTSFRFSVTAADTHPDKPGIGRSQEFLLRVVSDEELRADLLRREIEQRKAFEQAYETQMELASEIEAIAVKRPEPGITVEQFQAQQDTDIIALVRNQKTIGTSVARVADRFEEFLVEVKNNRLDEAENEIAPGQKIETRFDAGIIQPIRQLDQELISLATRNLDNCRRAAANEAELTFAVDQTSQIHQQILIEMKKILDAMNDSENFQEVINDLLEIKDDSSHLKTDIEKKLKPKNIFEDADGGIFDK